jgi:hypothetical protein
MFGLTSTTTSTVRSNTMKRWTESEKILLLALIQQGLKPREIAAKIDGRTESAVVNRIYSDRDAHLSYRGAKPKRRYVRGPYKTRKAQPVVQVKEPTVAEIRSVVDDNRIKLAMTSGMVGAAFSIATFILVLGALLS